MNIQLTTKRSRLNLDLFIRRIITALIHWERAQIAQHRYDP